MKESAKAGTVDQGSPRGWLRLLLRLPIVLYRLKLGWLFGHRFLLLNHTGRNSGLERCTVLEVLHYDPVSGRCVIASGWGTRSEWYKNVINDPRVRYTIGLRQRIGRAEQLSAERAEQQLGDYGRRYPAAIRKLTKIMIGEEWEGSPAQYRRLAGRVPVLELAPDARAPEA